MMTDKQISVGYMHSGYPIMTGLDVAADFVNTHTILTNGDGKTKSWGVPTSPEARASIADLTAWMPPDFPAMK